MLYVSEGQLVGRDLTLGPWLDRVEIKSCSVDKYLIFHSSGEQSAARVHKIWLLFL